LSNAKEVLQYHVISSNSYDLGELNPYHRYLARENGPIIRKLESEHIQVDCSLVIAKPIIAKNGVIYPIYKPLKPNILAGVVSAFKAGKPFPCLKA
jgi:uncharacterized surface protein with fasciclin (FAS1) repeats